MDKNSPFLIKNRIKMLNLALFSIKIVHFHEKLNKNATFSKKSIKIVEQKLNKNAKFSKRLIKVVCFSSNTE